MYYNQNILVKKTHQYDLVARHFLAEIFYEKKKKMSRLMKNQQNDCAPSEDSDQPGHPPSLISLHCPHEEALRSWLSFERTAKTDQTGRMLI